MTSVIEIISFFTVVCPGQALLQKESSVNGMPRFSNELIVDFQAVSLQVLPNRREFVLSESGGMFLRANSRHRGSLSKPNHLMVLSYFVDVEDLV